MEQSKEEAEEELKLNLAKYELNLSRILVYKVIPKIVEGIDPADQERFKQTENYKKTMDLAKSSIIVCEEIIEKANKKRQ